MKKEVIITLTACLLAAGSFINMQMGQNVHSMNFSLADISVMAQADGETGTNCINCRVSWENCPDGNQVIRCRPNGDGCFVEWQEPC
jgi:hypothetical protein